LYGRVPFRATALQVVICVLAAWTVGQAAGQAGVGRIEGQVRVIPPPAGTVPSGVYPSRRVSKPPTKASEISNVIVFLKDPPKRAELPPMHAVITQRDEAFVPRVVAITKGSTIDFPNADPFFHNVFSLSRGANFDLGRYPKGESKGRRFPNAGLVKVYCHIHSHMTAAIMVFDHPFFRIPAADGTFTLDDVPAGSYQISAWHERIGESSNTIKVEAGRTARIGFELPMQVDQ
jgi:plastocyanin